MGVWCVGGPSAALEPGADLPTLERLAQATGGSERSWTRCVCPFGLIALVIGAAGTGVSFSFSTPAQTKLVSLLLLGLGFILLLIAGVCWRRHHSRKRHKQENIVFSSEPL